MGQIGKKLSLLLTLIIVVTPTFAFASPVLCTSPTMVTGWLSNAQNYFLTKGWYYDWNNPNNSAFLGKFGGTSTTGDYEVLYVVSEHGGIQFNTTTGDAWAYLKDTGLTYDLFMVSTTDHGATWGEETHALANNLSPPSSTSFTASACYYSERNVIHYPGDSGADLAYTFPASPGATWSGTVFDSSSFWSSTSSITNRDAQIIGITLCLFTSVVIIRQFRWKL
jgi:hypothetical protein